MSKKYSILALLAGILLFLSFSSNPPNGNTGAPGDGLCSNCHTLNGGTQDGEITVAGMPATIIPNTAYTLTMTSSNPNGVASLAGFQLTILNSNNTIAGTITSPSAGSTVQTSSGRQYWEHNPAQPYPGSNMVTWTATWTAPNMPPNTTITIYAAGNIANGNGSSTGDRIDVFTSSGMLMGGGSTLTVAITSSTDVLCAGQNTGSATAMASGGTTPYVYNWSNGASGPTANNLAAGSYVVTVTDAASATATASVVIDEPNELILNTTVNNVTCNGGNNGSITASASGGAFPYFYNWSNGQTGSTISNLMAGSYTVTVTDDNNCTETATRVVTQPAAMVINLVNLDHETCAGEEDGTITISVTGGANPVFAEWSNGSIGMTVANLEPGAYSVTVTDNNDCTKTANYTINPGSIIDVNLVQIQHVTCFGGSNGAISINATGGVPPYTYLWSNGMTGSSITGLTAGNYLVTVTDMNSCSVVEGYTINQPTAVNAVISQTSQNLCFGDATADLTATASGGVPGYTGMWSNGVVGMSNPNVPAGTYSITVTDASGCTDTSSATVTQPPLLTVSVSTTNETSSGANDGTASANVNGGTQPYTYMWNTGAASQSITGLPPGMYCVTITDNNGCTVTGCGQVNEFGCSITTSLGPDQIICENGSVLLAPTITGASGTVTYLWTGGSTGSTLQVSDGGEYCVTVTDQANCQAADCMIVTEVIIPPFDCPVMNESAPGANDGSISCSIPGIISYLWSNGATTSGINNLSPGEYCVTVTDTNGCMRVQCFNVQPGDCQLSVNSTITNIACAGDSTGSIVLSVNGGTAPISYIWSNGDVTSSISSIPAGNYSVTVSDAAGCVSENQFTITEPEPITITVDSIRPVEDFDSGAISITVNGGFPPYSFLWTNDQGQSFTIEDLSSLFVGGYYSVIVTDAANCTAIEDSIFVDMIIAVEPVGKLKSLKIFPVPADDLLLVDLESAIHEVIITGVDGRTYKRYTAPESNRINVSELEAGWYILRISDGEKWYIARFVK